MLYYMNSYVGQRMYPVLSSFMTDQHVCIKNKMIIMMNKMPLVEEELLSLPENMSSPSVLSGVCVRQSLAFCILFSAIALSVLPRFTADEGSKSLKYQRSNQKS